MFLLFFCPANIYRPSLGKMRLGRPNPNWFSRSIFILEEKEKTHSTQNCMLYKDLKINFQFWFSYIFKKYVKKIIKKPVKFFNYTYNNNLVFFFLINLQIHVVSLCWCQHNLFHRVAMDNECLKQFWNFENPTFGKTHFNIFTVKIN